MSAPRFDTFDFSPVVWLPFGFDGGLFAGCVIEVDGQKIELGCVAKLSVGDGSFWHFEKV